MIGRSPTAKIRIEKRIGKTVTVIAGLHTYGTERLSDIAKEIKTSFGTGGTVKNGTIEIQGNKVTLIRAWFKDREHSRLDPKGRN